VDAHGTVYVADSLHRYIRVFSPQHRLVGDWPINIPGATVLQLAVAVGGRGNVIVAIAARVNCTVLLGPGYCATYFIVQRRSPAGTILSQFHSPIGPSGQVASPNVINQIAIVVDSQGDVYVATDGVAACYKDCGSFHYVYKHSSAGRVLARWGADELDVTANWPALAVGGRGNIFLADDFNHRLDKRTSSGKPTSHWSLTNLFPRLTTGPGGVTVDRKGAVYVSDPGSGRILKLTSAGKLLAQWGTGGSEPGRFWSPAGVALDARGRLWVDDSINQRVQALGLDGSFHVQFRLAHAGPAMALDHQGNVYIGQAIGPAVYVGKFSPSGKLLARSERLPSGLLSLGVPELPTGIAVAPNGDIFVVGDFYFGIDPKHIGLNGEDIVRLDPQGRQLGVIHVNDGSTGSGIAVDAQENTYIAYGPSPHFEKWSRDGTLLASWGAAKSVFVSPSPTGIALDPAGDIYVANTPQSLIEKFGPTGRLLQTWGFHGSYPGQFHHPGGIAMNAKGAIYVADTGNNRIQKFAP
jgi:DNA-binding beta-propeller fold protein YncE